MRWSHAAAPAYQRGTFLGVGGLNEELGCSSIPASITTSKSFTSRTEELKMKNSSSLLMRSSQIGTTTTPLHLLSHERVRFFSSSSSTRTSSAKVLLKELKDIGLVPNSHVLELFAKELDYADIPEFFEGLKKEYGAQVAEESPYYQLALIAAAKDDPEKQASLVEGVLKKGPLNEYTCRYLLRWCGSNRKDISDWLVNHMIEQHMKFSLHELPFKLMYQYERGEMSTFFVTLEEIMEDVAGFDIDHSALLNNFFSKSKFRFSTVKQLERFVNKLETNGVQLDHKMYSYLLNEWMSLGQVDRIQETLKKMISRGIEPGPALWLDIIKWGYERDKKAAEHSQSQQSN